MKPQRKSAPAPSAKSPARPRWQKWLLLGLLIYSVLGFLVLPAIVKWQLRKQLPGLTQRLVTVQQVRMNPYALSLTVRGLALTETNGVAFAGFDELYVNFQLSSVFRQAWTFGEIRLTHPIANLVRRADGSFNFSNLLSTNAPATNPPAGPPAIIIQALRVTNAVVTFADEATPKPFNATYGPINLALDNFTTRRDQHGPYTFVATTDDGESFSWAGHLAVHPPQSGGRFMLAGLSPAKYGPYLAQFTAVQVESGRLDVGADYRVNAARSPIELEVTNGTVALRDLRITPPASDTTLLALNHFVVTNASASLTGQVARVGRMALDGGSLLIGRETNGSPSLLTYLVTPTDEGNLAAPETTNANTPATAPWQIHFDELAITNFNVAVEDHSTPTVGKIGVNDIALKLKGLSNQTNAPLDLALAFDWRDGGGARITTRGTLLPPNLASTLAISNLALSPLQPWLAPYLNLIVHSGGLNLEARTQFNPAGTPKFHFAGDIGITNCAASDTVADQEITAWENHQLRGVDLSLHPNSLTIAEIIFTGARNHLAINSNGVLNVSALVNVPTTTNDLTAITPDSHPGARTPFPIRVGALVFERSSFHVTDDSLPRRFETQIEEFNATIRDIVLPGLNQATVDIRGKVSAAAPFEIVGTVTPDPQNLFVDLKVAFTNTDLTSLSAYTEKFVGRPLNRGKLTTELRYHIENRALTAANIVALDHLTFGARNNSPDATKLPVKLAVGLLKDVNGRIDLDLPITGSLDDPKFSIWGLVGQTFQNLIFKVASSPFSLLGALVGGGEELQFVEFDPGFAQLNANQTNKLMKLAEALTKRPALDLEISATFDSTADVAALGRQKVLAEMKQRHIEELVARGKTAPARSAVQLEADEYERLLRKAYEAAFNTTPEQALREALIASLATNNAGVVPAAAAVPVDSQKGAAALLARSKTLTQLVAEAGPAAGAATKTERELLREELERRLATTRPVTADERRALMQQRIEVVQKYLVEVAAIPAERLLPTAPNPADPNRQGQAQVVFALD